jgi:hypothetical protein
MSIRVPSPRLSGPAGPQKNLKIRKKGPWRAKFCWVNFPCNLASGDKAVFRIIRRCIGAVRSVFRARKDHKYANPGSKRGNPETIVLFFAEIVSYGRSWEAIRGRNGSGFSCLPESTLLRGSTKAHRSSYGRAGFDVRWLTWMDSIGVEICLAAK